VAVSIPNALNTSHFIKETHPSIPLCRLSSLTGTWSRPSSKRDANQKRKTVYRYSQEINYQHPATWLISWIKGQWVPGGKVNRPGREADHSPPPSTDVKKEWSYTSVRPYSFMSRTRTTLNLPCTCSRDNVSAHLLQAYSLPVTRKWLVLQYIFVSAVLSTAAVTGCPGGCWHFMRFTFRARREDKINTLYMGHLVLLRKRHLEDRRLATCLGWGTKECTKILMGKPLTECWLGWPLRK
jgi:hypothetical protein